MKRSILFLLAAATVATTACCSCRKTAKLEQPLTGTTWQLIQIMARDVVAEGESFTLVFNEDGNVAGVGACNRLMANFTFTPERALNIDNIGSTRMLCPNQAAEDEFFTVLDGVTHYEMDGDKMLMLRDGELVAIFQAKK